MRSRPANNLLPTSGAGCPRDTAYDVTVKPPISKVYKIHSDSEQYPTVGVLRDLFNGRDGIRGGMGLAPRVGFFIKQRNETFT